MACSLIHPQCVRRFWYAHTHIALSACHPGFWAHKRGTRKPPAQARQPAALHRAGRWMAAKVNDAATLLGGARKWPWQWSKRDESGARRGDKGSLACAWPRLHGQSSSHTDVNYCWDEWRAELAQLESGFKAGAVPTDSTGLRSTLRLSDRLFVCGVA